MIEALLDEFDSRLLRASIAYPDLELEIRKVKKHMSYAANNNRDPKGRLLNKDKTLRNAVKGTLEMVRRHPELKDFVKQIIVKAVNYLEPHNASTHQH